MLFSRNYVETIEDIETGELFYVPETEPGVDLSHIKTKEKVILSNLTRPCSLQVEMSTEKKGQCTHCFRDINLSASVLIISNPHRCKGEHWFCTNCARELLSRLDQLGLFIQVETSPQQEETSLPSDDITDRLEGLLD